MAAHEFMKVSYSDRRGFLRRSFYWMLFALGLSSSSRGVSAQDSPILRNIAFYYGKAPNPPGLARFQFAVVEPDRGFVPPKTSGKGTRWLAYVSVGEVTPSRDYYSAIPKAWIIGRNTEWGSDLLDQSAPEWPAFFIDRVITPLWTRGYRGFFLDTLDSYELFAKTDGERVRNRRGLIAVIRAINQRFPTAKIILNRGFKLLPDVHEQVYAVAFESLFKGWSEARRSYTDVSERDREWLMNQAETIMQRYGLPVIAIDYCPPGDGACASQTVRRIRAEGLVPYVTDGHLQTLNFAAL